MYAFITPNTSNLTRGEVPVPTLEGKANLRIPAGTQSGQVFKLRGKGIANIEGRGHGDLLARVMVEVPTRLQILDSTHGACYPPMLREDTITRVTT